MSKGITHAIAQVLRRAERPMSGDEVYRALTGVPVPTPSMASVKTILTQRCKRVCQQPALWRKVGRDSYAAITNSPATPGGLGVADRA